MRGIALTLSLLLLCFLSLHLAAQWRHGTPWVEAVSRSSWKGPLLKPGAADTIWIRRTNYYDASSGFSQMDKIFFREKAVEFRTWPDEHGNDRGWSFATTSPLQEGTTVEPLILLGKGEPRPDTVWVEFRVSDGPEKLVWAQPDLEMRKVAAGDLLEMEWRFRNDSEHALYISNIVTSTGALSPKWSEMSVMPHQESDVTIKFLTKGIMRLQSKCIPVTYNEEPDVTVSCFKCEVVPRLQEPPAPVLSPPVESAVGHSGMATQPNPVGIQEPLTEIAFDSTTIRHPDITSGEDVIIQWRFKNVGKHPAFIKNVKGSGGNLLADPWTTDPIQPGEYGIIRGSFTSQGKVGLNNKTITVHYNGSPQSIVLTFQVNILPGPAPITPRSPDGEQAPPSTDRH